MTKKESSFNDKMVKRTVLPTIYLWLLASGALENERERDAERKSHIIEMEKAQMTHAHEISKLSQEHEHIVEKHKETIVKLKPVKKMGE